MQVRTFCGKRLFPGIFLGLAPIALYLSTVFFWVVPILFFVAFQIIPRRWVAVLFLLNAGLMALLAGPDSLILFSLLAWVIPWILHESARNGLRFEESLLLSSLVAFVAVFITLIVLSHQFDHFLHQMSFSQIRADWNGFLSWLDQLFTQLSKSIAAQWEQVREQVSTSQDRRHILADAYSIREQLYQESLTVLLSFFILLSSLTALLGARFYHLSRWALFFRGRSTKKVISPTSEASSELLTPGGAAENVQAPTAQKVQGSWLDAGPDFFSHFKVREEWVWLVLFCGFVMLVEIPVLDSVCSFIFKSVMVLYGLQGLAISSVILRKFRVKPAFRPILLGVGLLFFSPFLASLGFFDLWFQFRERVHRNA